MKRFDDFTWRHKKWLIIWNGIAYYLWRASDPVGAQPRGMCPTLAVAKYLIEQDTLHTRWPEMDCCSVAGGHGNSKTSTLCGTARQEWSV